VNLDPEAVRKGPYSRPTVGEVVVAKAIPSYPTPHTHTQPPDQGTNPTFHVEQTQKTETRRAEREAAAGSESIGFVSL